MNIYTKLSSTAIFIAIVFSHLSLSLQHWLTGHLIQKSEINNNQQSSQSLCPAFCLQCDSLTQNCYQCKTGYTLLTNGQCQQCSIGCLYCSGKQMCQKCLNGYVRSTYAGYSECLPCGPGCQSCRVGIQVLGQSTLNTSCTLCFPTFYSNRIPNTNQTVCSPCLPGCYSCSNSTFCFQCFAGYGYNDNEKTCYTCQQNCLNCNPVNGCFQCALGYYITSNSSMEVCSKCQQNCIKCEMANDCSLCKEGYYALMNVSQQTSICVNCPNQCKLCHSQNKCISCISGYYLLVIQQTQYNDTTNMSTTQVISATCQPCSSNCLSCSADLICLTCQNGYFVNYNGNCQLCGVACHSCSAQNQCTSCEGSFYLQNGQCQQCSQLCSSCQLIIINNQPVSFCYSCVSVYYTTSETGKCILCSDILQQCSTCQSASQCLSCNDGYYLHEGACLMNQKGLGAAYIVMLTISGIIAVIAIGFAIWACWRHRNGYGIIGGNASNSGVRASYYQIP